MFPLIWLIDSSWRDNLLTERLLKWRCTVLHRMSPITGKSKRMITPLPIHYKIATKYIAFLIPYGSNDRYSNAALSTIPASPQKPPLFFCFLFFHNQRNTLFHRATPIWFAYPVAVVVKPFLCCDCWISAGSRMTRGVVTSGTPVVGSCVRCVVLWRSCETN